MAAFANTLEGMCQRVYARLADDFHNPATWDKDQVETAVCDAFWLLSIIRPGLFTDTQKIELEPGICVQTLPDDCRTANSFSCVEVDGVRAPVIEGDFFTIESTAFFPGSRRKRCRSRGAASPVAAFHVAINPDNPRSFAISPLVDEGAEVFLYADCVAISDFVADACKEFDDNVRPYIMPIIELALYNLYSTDREAPEVAAMANASLQTFLQITSITAAAVAGAQAQLASQVLGNG